MLAQITHGISPSIIDLQPNTIKEAIRRVNITHTGQVLFVKTFRKASRVVGTTLLVEDSNNDLIALNLYNCVSPVENPQLVFSCGTYIAVLEPYLRFAQVNPDKIIIPRTDIPQRIIVYESGI